LILFDIVFIGIGGGCGQSGSVHGDGVGIRRCLLDSFGFGFLSPNQENPRIPSLERIEKSLWAQLALAKSEALGEADETCVIADVIG
jgi:hypothetical protein